MGLIDFFNDPNSAVIFGFGVGVSAIFLIGVTKKSVQELNGSINNPLYLPNGVDEKLFFPESRNNDSLTIGYVGFLETYGVDKGVLNAVNEIIEINKHSNTRTFIVGGPESKLEKIREVVKAKKQEDNFQILNFHLGRRSCCTHSELYRLDPAPMLQKMPGKQNHRNHRNKIHALNKFSFGECCDFGFFSAAGNFVAGVFVCGGFAFSSQIRKKK